MQALRSNNVRTLLISEGIRRALVRLQCRECGGKETRIVDLDELEEFEANISDVSCLKCGNGSYEVMEKEDLIEALVKTAEKTDAVIEIISNETEEGEMLLKSFGGLGAVLKYRQFQ